MKKFLLFFIVFLFLVGTVSADDREFNIIQGGDEELFIMLVPTDSETGSTYSSTSTEQTSTGGASVGGSTRSSPSQTTDLWEIFVPELDKTIYTRDENISFDVEVRKNGVPYDTPVTANVVFEGKTFATQELEEIDTGKFRFEFDTNNFIDGEYTVVFGISIAQAEKSVEFIIEDEGIMGKFTPKRGEKLDDTTLGIILIIIGIGGASLLGLFWYMLKK